MTKSIKNKSRKISSPSLELKSYFDDSTPVSLIVCNINKTTKFRYRKARSLSSKSKFINRPLPLKILNFLNQKGELRR